MECQWCLRRIKIMKKTFLIALIFCFLPFNGVFCSFSVPGSRICLCSFRFCDICLSAFKSIQLTIFDQHCEIHHIHPSFNTVKLSQSFFFSLLTPIKSQMILIHFNTFSPFMCKNVSHSYCFVFFACFFIFISG